MIAPHGYNASQGLVVGEKLVWKYEEICHATKLTRSKLYSKDDNFDKEQETWKQPST